MLEIVPVKWRQACEFIARHHRHHKPPQGWMFGIGIEGDGLLCGVAMVGRPVSRHRDDGKTLEVTRLCTDGTKNAASKLYAACWRAARAMGYRRLGTYLLASESGTSATAAGFKLMHSTPGRSWSVPSRPREDKTALCERTLWEVSVNSSC